MIVASWWDKGNPRKTIAFCVDVGHAHDLCSAFIYSGVEADVIVGTTPLHERRDILRRFANDEIDVLCNCMVLTEGFDEPTIQCIVMARPTSSRSLYAQAIGRGLRTSKDKEDCLILDYVDNCRKHKLVTILDLMGAPEQLDGAGGGRVLEAAQESAKQCFMKKTYDPLNWVAEFVCPWPDIPTLHGYTEIYPWHGDSPSEGQLKYLRVFGCDIGRRLTKGEASFLINRCIEYDVEYPRPASSKQRWFLEQRGKWRPKMSLREASKAIGEIKNEEVPV